MPDYADPMTDGDAPTSGALHHVELRVGDLDASRVGWEWLFGALGYREFQSWPQGVSWMLGSTYIVLEQAPRDEGHDRRGAGLSHLAFHAGTRSDVDALWAAAPLHGWSHLYADQHPWAGGEPAEGSSGHYAAFLENSERFKIELVATTPTPDAPAK